jgi:hypothetical protein
VSRCRTALRVWPLLAYVTIGMDFAGQGGPGTRGLTFAAWAVTGPPSRPDDRIVAATTSRADVGFSLDFSGRATEGFRQRRIVMSDADLPLAS